MILIKLNNFRRLTYYKFNEFVIELYLSIIKIYIHFSKMKSLKKEFKER